MSHALPPRRVVITGIGPVSALGIGREAFFAALAAGRSGVDEITLFDPEKYGSLRAAEVRSFHIEEYLESQKGYLDRATEFALAAMALAVEDANLDLAQENRARCALMLGSAFGSQDTACTFFSGFLEKGPRLAKPLLFPHTYANTAISMLAIEHKLDGPHLHFSSGGVAAAQAIVAAVDSILSGRADFAFAGGFEALNPAVFATCAQQGWLARATPDVPEASRPFDRRRNGFVLGEGAGILVLEDDEHAQRRGAQVYAEFAGVGDTGDRVSAVQRALTAAGADAAAIAGVFAAANGSVAGDAAECEALAAAGLAGVSVTSIKPLTGETLGAAAAFQVMAAVAAKQQGQLPAIAHLEQPEPGVALAYVRGAPLSRQLPCLLVNAADPGGAAVSLVLR